MTSENDDDDWQPNEIDADAEAVGGSLDGQVIPVGDPTVTSLVAQALTCAEPGVRARVGVQEHYILSSTVQPDGATMYRWVLEELHARGVR